MYERMRFHPDQPPQYRKWLLVSDHKQTLALFRSGRFWRRFVVAWLPAFCAIAYRAWTDFAAISVIVGVFVSVGVTAILLHSLLRHGIITILACFCESRSRFVSGYQSSCWLSDIVLS